MFPNRLESLRKEKKLSQQYMGDYLGVTRQAYGKYENGDSEPDIATINKLATFFGVTTDFLLGKTNKKDGQINSNKDDKSYDSLAEITKMVKELGLEQFGFFNIEKWKNLSPEDVDEIRRHFEWVAQKAKERNEEKD